MSESDNTLVRNSVVKCCLHIYIDLASRSRYGCAFAWLFAFGLHLHAEGSDGLDGVDCEDGCLFNRIRNFGDERELRVQGLVFSVSCLGFRAWDLLHLGDEHELRVQGLVFSVSCLGFRAWGLLHLGDEHELRVWRLDFRGKSLEFRVEGLELRVKSEVCSISLVSVRRDANAWRR